MKMKKLWQHLDPRPHIAVSEARTEVVRAAEVWVDRIVDAPNLWADEADFALLAAVQAYRRTLDEL